MQTSQRRISRRRKRSIFPWLRRKRRQPGSGSTIRTKRETSSESKKLIRRRGREKEKHKTRWKKRNWEELCMEDDVFGSILAIIRGYEFWKFIRLRLRPWFLFLNLAMYMSSIDTLESNFKIQHVYLQVVESLIISPHVCLTDRLRWRGHNSFRRGKIFDDNKYAHRPCRFLRTSLVIWEIETVLAVWILDIHWYLNLNRVIKFWSHGVICIIFDANCCDCEVKASELFYSPCIVNNHQSIWCACSVKSQTKEIWRWNLQTPRFEAQGGAI